MKSNNDYSTIIETLRAISEQDGDLIASINKIAGVAMIDNVVTDNFFSDHVYIDAPSNALEKLITVKILDEHVSHFDKMLAEYVAFKRKLGNIKPDKKNSSYSLSIWWQSMKNKKHLLSPDKLSRLINIGFEFSLKREDKWEKRFREMEAWLKFNNKAPTIITNKILSKWFEVQKTFYRSNRLDACKASRLKELNLDLQIITATNKVTWHNNYRAYTNCLKTNTWPKKMKTWEVRQRSEFKRGRLSKEAIQKLKIINFDFKGKSRV